MGSQSPLLGLLDLGTENSLLPLVVETVGFGARSSLEAIFPFV